VRLLFVCTGNTCRSPMAEGLASKILQRLKLTEKIDVFSAGIAALPGAPASSEAHSVLFRQGLDLSGHKARQLTKEMINDADLILTMTAAQKQLLQEFFPDMAEKIFIVKEFSEATNSSCSCCRFSSQRIAAAKSVSLSIRYLSIRSTLLFLHYSYLEQWQYFSSMALILAILFSWRPP
jgi:protein-tyrosine-phosphatase